jgi:hypothetical protein
LVSYVLPNRSTYPETLFLPPRHSLSTHRPLSCGTSRPAQPAQVQPCTILHASSSSHSSTPPPFFLTSTRVCFSLVAPHNSSHVFRYSYGVSTPVLPPLPTLADTESHLVQRSVTIFFQRGLYSRTTLMAWFVVSGSRTVYFTCNRYV